MKAVYILVLLVAVALNAGCAQQGTQAPAGTVEVQTRKVPASTMEDTNIAAYPGAEGVSSIADKFTSWNTPDKPEKVIAFYRTEMPAKGWVINEEWTQKVMKTPGETRLVALKGNTVCELRIKPDGVFTGKTEISANTTDLENYYNLNENLRP